jgi:hypothetical protein
VGLPPYEEAPQLGQNGPKFSKSSVFRAEIAEMEANKELIVDRRFI